MCSFCAKYICPPACPRYSGENAEKGKLLAVCHGCGRSLREYDNIDFSYGKPYCFECFYNLLNSKNNFSEV